MNEAAFVLFLVALFVATISGFFGVAIGSQRNLATLGFWLGFWLGPLGWILACIWPEPGKPCPECCGTVAVGARRCRHCGAEATPTTSAPLKSIRLERPVYILNAKNEPEGPFTPRQIQALQESGKVTLETPAAPHGASVWKPLGELV